MRKTKLLASLAAFVLVIGLGACELPDEETSSEESGVTTETDTAEGGETTDTDTTPKETNPDGYVLVGDFIDSDWDSKVSEDSKYYIPLGTTEYKQTVTIAAEPDYGSYSPWDAGLRVVEWGDSWNLVVGSDELDEASTGVTGSDNSKNIKVKWGETYDITITFGETNSILVTLQTEEGGDEGGNEPQLLGSFDFSSNTENGNAITSSDALDSFWSGEDLYLGLRQYDVVYLGNGSNGAFADVTTLIKFGTSSANGSMQLKFALGVSITEVVVTAHSWYAVSDQYPTQEPNQLVINGTSQDCSVSGTATELTYEITDDFTYLLTFESVGRVTIHSIDIYGTYEPDAVEPITSLTLTADTTELNVGESAHVSVAYEPADAVFDIDTLTWTSNSDAASVERTLTGADIRGEASGEATITATAENGVAGSIMVTVQDVLEESETFVSSQLGYNDATAVPSIDGHQVTITFALGTQSTSSNVPKYYTSGSAIRVYAGNTITFSAKYENAPISSIVLTCQSTSYTGSTLTCTNCTSSLSGSTITLTPTGSGDPVLSPSGTSNSQLRITQFTIHYNLAA